MGNMEVCQVYARTGVTYRDIQPVKEITAKLLLGDCKEALKTIMNWYSICGHLEKRDKMNQLWDVSYDRKEKGH